MYDYLKALFGTDENGNPAALTFEQLEQAIAANKELKLVNLADGGYVSKDKFDAKETELTGVKQQLATANTTIQSYKDMDIDGIKQSAADWEKKYNDDTAALTAKLAEQEQAHSLDMFLGGYKFTSKAAKDGIRAAIVGKKFPFENGGFIGAKEYMDGLMTNDDYKGAFVVDTPPASPAPEQPPKPQFSDPNPQQPQRRTKKSLAELMAMKNENPNAAINFD